ncbi:MAG: hypothetical protein QG630_58, partial [Patescibacteria group bacterium]|nr:hypothetical protein [Patescibacteria group bacterium]
GAAAGNSAGSTDHSNFFGLGAGQNATSSSYSNFLGSLAGDGAYSSNNSNFLGASAGSGAYSSYNSNFFGNSAGSGATSTSFSNLFGFQTGKTFSGNNIGSNNIIIGTNISLPNARANGLNLGGILFGTGTASSTAGNPSITPKIGGKIGIGTNSPITQFHVAGEVPTVKTSEVSITNTGRSTYVQGNYAYVVNDSSELQVVDVSDKAAPVVIGSVSTQAVPYSVYVQGRYAYVSSDTYIETYDISNPVSPTYISSLALGQEGWSIYVQGRYAYIGKKAGTFDIFDIIDPANIVSVGTVAIAGGGLSVYVQGRYAYVGEDSSKFEVIDVSDPTAPSVVSTATPSGAVRGVYVQGRYAYLATDNSTLEIYDISDPVTPVAADTEATSGIARSVYVQGRYAYVATEASTLEVYNVSDPADISLVGTVGTSEATYSVFVQGRFAYTSNARPELEIFDMGGAYIQQFESGGVETGTLSVRNNLHAVSGSFLGGLTIGDTLNVSRSVSIGTYLTVGNASISGAVARFTNSSGYCDIDPTNSSLSCSSDETLKKNILSLDANNVDKFMSLRSVTYNWNSEKDTDSTHTGFIAQEVEALFPNLVATDSKTGLKSVNYIGFIPYTVEAVQSLNKGLITLNSASTGSFQELNNKFADLNSNLFNTVQELNRKVIDLNSTSSALLFSNVGSSTLINNTIQNSLNTLSLFLASTTDLEIASTTLANLNDLFSTSSLASIKALTNSLTRSNFDLNLNGNALVNVKSIESASKNWKLGEDGIIYAKEIRADRYCNSTGTKCIDISDLSGATGTNTVSNGGLSSSSEAASTDTTTASAPVDTTTTSAPADTDTTTASSPVEAVVPVDTTTASAPVEAVVPADTTTASAPVEEASPAPTTSSIPVVIPPAETAPETTS